MPFASARLTIDLDALAANYRTLAAETHGAEIAPVVKADGYGLGANEIARRLMSEGARRFFVARLDEGERLRAALGPDPQIYVLDGCPPGAASRLGTAGLVPVLNTLDQAANWQGEAALMIDTGLSRLGVSETEARLLATRPFTYVMSHLACADQPEHPMNRRQRERFLAVAALFPDARRSLAASDGLFLGPNYTFDLVRTGICLYGGGPHGMPYPRIRPVATFEAPILQVRTLQPGDRAGYGAAFTATGETKVAVVAVGYADGVLRAGFPNIHGSLAGRRCPVVGRISMDLTLYDITDHPEPTPGEMMQVVGPEVLLDDFARASGTIAYEVLTRLGARAERHYLGRA